MNLQSLSSGLPKPWLDIACNKITCNELVVAVQPSNSQLFQLVQGVSSPAVGSTTALCDVNQIVNPNVNLVANTYTAPVAQFVDVSLKGVTSLGNNVTNPLISPLVTLTVNGVDVAGAVVINTITLPAFGSIASNLNTIVQLQAGDVLGYRVTNVVVATLFSQFYSFSGVVV